jgi:hypothetical protein
MSLESEQPSPAGENADDISAPRLVARLSGAYVLRAFQLLIDLHGGMRAGLIAQSIHAANTAHVDPRTEEGRARADPSGMLPNDARLPISIARLADSAGLPFESTRRIVQRLAQSGACVRVEGGVIMPASMVDRPDNVRIVKSNLGYVRKFMRDLQVAGLASPPALGPAAPEDTDIRFARFVARPSGDYLLRSLQLLADTYGDLRTGVIAQTIVTANTAHLDARAPVERRFPRLDEAQPDAVRKPISIARLAESLGLAYETARGQAHRLIDAGIAVHVEGGLIVPAAVLERPPAVDSVRANIRHVRRFVRDLQLIEATRSLAQPH